MKLSYQTICWGHTHSLGLGIVGHPVGVTNIKDLHYVTNASIETALQDIAAAGYAGFELFDGDLMAYADRKDDFQALTQATGLQFVAVYAGANLIYPDILPEELWKIERTCLLAAELGAQHLVVGAGARRSSGTTEKDYDLLAEGLDQVMTLAEKHGLIASYHPHLSTMVETPDELEKIMSRSRINFCPDTAHVAAGGGDPVEIIQRYGSRIKYIHFKDFNPTPFSFLPLGQGQLDFGGMMNALRDHHYDGWITVELDIYAGPPSEAANISKAYLAKL
jgi:inosose dehydratase